MTDLSESAEQAVDLIQEDPRDLQEGWPLFAQVCLKRSLSNRISTTERKSNQHQPRSTVRTTLDRASFGCTMVGGIRLFRFLYRCKRSAIDQKRGVIDRSFSVRSSWISGHLGSKSKKDSLGSMSEGH